MVIDIVGKNEADNMNRNHVWKMCSNWEWLGKAASIIEKILEGGEEMQ